MPNGQMIPVTDARTISKKHDTIHSDFLNKIKPRLQTLGAADDTVKYYGSDVKAFIFDLQTIKNYLNNVTGADSLLIIKAADMQRNSVATVIVAAAKADGNTYTVVPNGSDEVGEHPGESGSVDFGDDNKTLIFKIQ